MSYYEFIIMGDLTPKYEEKTQMILDEINEGTAIYRLEKYYDEEITTDKKKRTVVITSPLNITNNLYGIVKDCNLQMVGYYKQRIM